MPLSEDIAAVTERAQLEQAARGSADALAGLFELHAAMVHRAGESFTILKSQIDIWRYSWLIRGRNIYVSMSG